VRCRATFSFVALSSPAEPPQERHGSALRKTRPKSRCRPSSHQSASENVFKSHPEIANPNRIGSKVNFDTCLIA
jgi:hypothetical protein